MFLFFLEHCRLDSARLLHGGSNSNQSGIIAGVLRILYLYLLLLRLLCLSFPASVESLVISRHSVTFFTSLRAYRGENLALEREERSPMEKSVKKHATLSRAPPCLSIVVNVTSATNLDSVRPWFFFPGKNTEWACFDFVGKI